MSFAPRTVAIVGSAVLHAVLIGLLAASVPPPKAPKAIPARVGVAVVNTMALTITRPARAQMLRVELTQRALEDRRLGKLLLGRFVLTANAIDAEEEGAPFDLLRATKLYDARVADLRVALDHDPPGRAVPKMFGDLRYTGFPGGRMGDALLLGSGSCEPLSQLIASALYDAALGDKSHLRYYGGESAGVSHLAPVIRSNRLEWDLVSGKESVPGGRDFKASELIEAYAREHGIVTTGATAEPVAIAKRRTDEEAPGDGEAGLFGSTPITKTMAAGYPSNPDRFDGALPLYADRAVSDPLEASKLSEAAATGGDGDDGIAESCAVYLRLGELDPPRASIFSDGSDDAVEVTLQHVPARPELERTATIIAELERAKIRVERDPMRKLIVLGCLAGLYDRASLEFSFAREPMVAARAALESEHARKEGAEIILARGLAGDKGASDRQSLIRDFPTGTWVIIRFDGGAEALEKVAHDASDDSFTAINLAAALIVNPSSRERGVALAAGFPLDSQIATMQELAHAHDNARPWSGTYDPDISTFGTSPGAIRFAHAYRVLRPVAWRLWEVPRPPEETIVALLDDAKAQLLDPKTTRAIVAYFVQNELWLYARRDEAGRVFSEIDASLRLHGFGPLLDFDDVKPFPGDAHTIEAALANYSREAGGAPKKPITRGAL